MNTGLIETIETETKTTKSSNWQNKGTMTLRSYVTTYSHHHYQHNQKQWYKTHTFITSPSASHPHYGFKNKQKDENKD